jgi:hypothetical protein
MGKSSLNVNNSDDSGKLPSSKNIVNAIVNTMVWVKQGNDKLQLKYPKNSNRNKATTTKNKQAGRRNYNHGNYFKAFHQNIRGIKGKMLCYTY